MRLNGIGGGECGVITTRRFELLTFAEIEPFIICNDLFSALEQRCDRLRADIVSLLVSLSSTLLHSELALE